VTQPIVFGTDGWRARVAEDYTYDNVRICAQAVADWVNASGEAARGAVVGYDRRFCSEFFAQAAAEVLAANGIRTLLADKASPTQSISYAVPTQRAFCGVVITASHNPWTDNGFKVKTQSGAAAAPDVLAVLERSIREMESGKRAPKLDEGRSVPFFDPKAPYLARVAQLFDLQQMRGAGLTVVAEPLYGSAAGYFTELLGGGATKVVELHQERNPFFGGVNPEPIPPNIDEFLARIPREHADVGLAVDGDADRAGFADERGAFINQLQVYALLMWYLLEVRKMRQPVVKTVNMTLMADRLGAAYGVPVYEVPVGFKYIGPKMQETGAMMGGEESGGFGFAMHLPERDGVVADLFLLDFCLKTKKKPSELLAELQAKYGPSYYLRRDVRFPADEYQSIKKRTLARLADEHPEALAGKAVRRITTLDTKDGVKYFRDDDSWLLIRFSGTEPLVRIYTETRTPDDVQPMLDAGAMLAGVKKA
jgi:phosphomannomutase